MNLKPPKQRQMMSCNNSKSLRELIRSPEDGAYQLARAIKEQALVEDDRILARIWYDIITCYEEFK